MRKSEKTIFNGRKGADYNTRSQIFVLGTRSARFESEKKPLLLLFLTSEKSLPVTPF